MSYPYAEALFACNLAHAGGGEATQAAACYGGALAILGRLGERPYAGLIERALLEGNLTGQPARETSGRA
jgi:hypothetical protein